jgi:hypothetical protein
MDLQTTRAEYDHGHDERVIDIVYRSCRRLFQSFRSTDNHLVAIRHATSFAWLLFCLVDYENLQNCPEVWAVGLCDGN